MQNGRRAKIRSMAICGVVSSQSSSTEREMHGVEALTRTWANSASETSTWSSSFGKSCDDEAIVGFNCQGCRSDSAFTSLLVWCNGFAGSWDLGRASAGTDLIHCLLIR
jgi:hypothetical protein